MRLPLATLFLILLAGLLGCQPQAAPEQFVARLGDQYLTEEEVAQQLIALPPLQDSTHARQQIVDRWITDQLLLREAHDRGMRDDPEVQRLMADNERSVLISALINKLYEEHTEDLTRAEIQAYFEQHKEQLRLREPFARVRYLATRTATAAQQVQRQLQDAASEAAADSLWSLLVEQHALTPDISLLLSGNLFPQSHLLTNTPALHEALKQLQRGQSVVITEHANLHHLIWLAERVPEGTLPRLSWILDELRPALVIEARKQMYARQVQRLRSEALSREELEIR